MTLFRRWKTSRLNDSTAIDVLVGTSPWKRKGRLPVHVNENSPKKKKRLYDDESGKSIIGKRHIQDLKNMDLLRL
jgi:hypothetical protein